MPGKKGDSGPMAGKEKKSNITVRSTATAPENKAAEGKLHDLQASAKKARISADAAAQRKADERAEAQAAAEKAARKKAGKEAEAARNSGTRTQCAAFAWVSASWAQRS